MKKKYLKRTALKQYKNKTHHGLMSEIDEVLTDVQVEELKIAKEKARLEKLLADEFAVINEIRKYETTDDIHDTDKLRDSIFKVINAILKAALNSFDQTTDNAAERLKIVFDTFGNIACLSYDEETVAINKLLQELDARQEDVITLNLTHWVSDLRTANETLSRLMDERYSEEARRAHFNMKKVRAEVDDTYFAIVDKLESGAILNGEEAYNELFANLNARITRYNTIFAQEKGRRKQNRSKDTLPTENGME
jgi:hypothetical protein